MSDKPIETRRLETAIINLRRESSAKKHQLLRLAKDATNKKGIGDMAKRLSRAEDENHEIAKEADMLHQQHLDDVKALGYLKGEFKLLVVVVVFLAVMVVYAIIFL